jgi:RND family efflux transporter MFP subunit
MPDKDSAKAGSKWLWLLGLALCLVLVGGGVWWQFFRTKTVTVAVETVAEAPTQRVLAVNGQVAAITSVLVRSPVSGILQGTMAVEGDKVSAGALLARVDPTQQQAVVRQAQSALDQGLLVQTQAASDYARLRDLAGVATRSAIEDSQVALAKAGQSVESLRAQLEQAQIQLDRYRIAAPIAGTITQRNVDPGQYIDPSTALFTLSDLSSLVIETNVDEAYATQITQGQSASLQRVGTTETLPGKVSFVAPRVDTATGGLKVKITPDSVMVAPVGLTVTANIVVEEQPNALTIPRAAMITGPAVYLLKSGKAVKTAVEVIDWPATRLIVTKGLAVGDVLIANATGITEGEAVKASAALAVPEPVKPVAAPSPPMDN